MSFVSLTVQHVYLCMQLFILHKNKQSLIEDVMSDDMLRLNLIGSFVSQLALWEHFQEIPEVHLVINVNFYVLTLIHYICIPNGWNEVPYWNVIEIMSRKRMTNTCEPARRRLLNFNYVFSPLVKLNLFHVCHILPSNPFNKHISINIDFFVSN